MSSLFDDLKEGLEEAIAYEKGTGKAARNRDQKAEWHGILSHSFLPRLPSYAAE